MSSYHRSPKSDVAYAMNQLTAAEVVLVTGAVVVATFIVSYSLTSMFGHGVLVSMTASFLSSVSMGAISLGLYLCDVRASHH